MNVLDLVAIDLDGTLLNSHDQISPANKQQVQRLAASGATIAIATGRSVLSARQIIQELEIDAYALALNGTYIAEITKNAALKTLRKVALKRDILQRAVSIAESFGITFIASSEFHNDRVIFNEKQTLVQEFRVQRPDLKNICKEEMLFKLNDPAAEYLKAAFTDQNIEKLGHLKTALAENGIETIFSDTHYIELVPPQTNKGAALAFICDYLKLDIKKTAALGDQENDLEMLAASGIGVAMGNAKQRVKDAADLITADNNNDGVAKFLQKIK